MLLLYDWNSGTDMPQYSKHVTQLPTSLHFPPALYPITTPQLHLCNLRLKGLPRGTSVQASRNTKGWRGPKFAESWAERRKKKMMKMGRSGGRNKTVQHAVKQAWCVSPDAVSWPPGFYNWKLALANNCERYWAVAPLRSLGSSCAFQGFTGSYEGLDPF